MLFGSVGEKFVVGVDLGGRGTQVSYMPLGGQEASTYSQRAGVEDFLIPNALCKRRGAGQWYVGRDALRVYETGEGDLVEGILAKAESGEEVELDGQIFAAQDLLTLFLRRVLTQVPALRSLSKIAGITVTGRELEKEARAVIYRSLEDLKLSTKYIQVSSYGECTCQYTIHQPPALWKDKVFLLDYVHDQIGAWVVELGTGEKPVVMTLTGRMYPFFAMEHMPQSQALQKERYHTMDMALLAISRDFLDKDTFSAVYLVGEEFDEAWMKESGPYLCAQGRQVLMGVNLCSKGAVLAMNSRIRKDALFQDYIYLGRQKLKLHIGARLTVRGQDQYVPLLDAGMNWPEAVGIVELYPEEDGRIELICRPVLGGEETSIFLHPEGFPPGERRLGLRLWMSSQSVLAVEITDLGFGELAPSTRHKWTREILLNGILGALDGAQTA